MTEQLETYKQMATEIFNVLGAGYEEAIYQKAFEVELRLANIPYEDHTVIPVFYKGYNIGEQKLDLLIKVSNQSVLEFKVATGLSLKDENQLRVYMRLLNVKSGLLINFCQCGTAKSAVIPTTPEFIEVSEPIEVK